MPSSPQEPPTDAAAKRWDLVGVVALVVAGLLLRLRYLGAADLWPDEACSWLASAGDWKGLSARIVAYEVKPPLYSALLHFWIRLFGDSEVAMRTLSLLLWPPLALTILALGRRCCGRWALLALALAASSPLLVYHGVEARHYGMLLLAQTAFALLALKSLEDGSPSLRIGIALSAFAVLAIQFTGLFFVVPILGYLLYRKRGDRAELRRLLLPLAVAGVLYALLLLATLPGIFARLQEVSGNWWAPSPSPVQIVSAFPRLLTPVSSWHFYTGAIPFLVSAAVLALLAFAGLLLSGRRGFLISASAGVLSLFVAYSLLRSNLLYPRYFIGCAPILLIGTACALERVARRSRPFAGILLAVVASAQLLAFVTLPPFERVPEYGRAVDAILAHERGPVVVLSSEQDQLPLRYYSRRESGRVRIEPGAAALEGSLSEGRPLYYLESFSWKDRTGAFEREFSRLKPVRTLLVESAGVQVFRLSPSTP